jgi:hypothetical protein
MVVNQWHLMTCANQQNHGFGMLSSPHFTSIAMHCAECDSLARKKMFGTKAAGCAFLRNKNVFGLSSSPSPSPIIILTHCIQQPNQAHFHDKWDMILQHLVLPFQCNIMLISSTIHPIDTFVTRFHFLPNLM